MHDVVGFFLNFFLIDWLIDWLMHMTSIKTKRTMIKKVGINDEKVSKQIVSGKNNNKNNNKSNSNNNNKNKNNNKCSYKTA